MSEIAGFTPEQGRALWLDYQRRMAANPQIRDNFPLRRTIDEVSPHRVLIKNTESEELPAYGCVEVIGTSEVGERTVIEVRKPTRTDGEYLFVSQYAIPEAGSSPEALGVGWAYRYGVVRMLGTPPSSDPARYRPIVDSYEVEEGEGPFVVYGEDTVVEGALIGRIVGGVAGIRFGITVSGGDTYPEAVAHPNMYKFKFIEFAHQPGDTNAVGESDVNYEETTTETYDGYVYNVADADALPIEAYIPEKTVIELHPNEDFYLTDYRADHIRVKATGDIDAYQDDGCPVEGDAIVMHASGACESEWKNGTNPDDDYKIGEVKIYNVGNEIKADDHLNVYQISGKWYTSGKGSSAQIIRFLFEDNASSSSSSSLPSSSSSGEEFCVLDIPPIEDIIAKVVAPACGSEFPPDMDDDGNIGLVDHLGLLVDRKPEDLVGRQGIAVRLKASDDSGPGGVGPCNCWVASGPLSLNTEMTGAGWQLIADAPNGLWVICAETAPAVGTGVSTPVRGNPTDTHPAYNIDANLVPSCCNCGPVASSNVECEWVIVYIDFHRWVTVITDFTVEDNQIRIRRKNVKVWDDCRLPDEIITGADCPTESSSSSLGSV